MPKYALDTQLFIEAFRDRDANEALRRFHAELVPFEYLSAVVAHELRSGVRSVKAGRDLERHLLKPFRDRRRFFGPSAFAWELAGDVLARLAATEGLDLRSISSSFRNDVLLAVSCREQGITLVTRNGRDFQRIRRQIDFDFVPPWPSEPG